MLTIADLIESSNVNGDNIQETVAKRGEFYDLRYGQGQKSNLFRYQEIVKRLMIARDRLMIYHRPGRGKTCALGGGIEYYHSLALNLLDTIIDFSSSISRPLIV